MTAEIGGAGDEDMIDKRFASFEDVVAPRFQGAHRIDGKAQSLGFYTSCGASRGLRESPRIVDPGDRG